jgi:transposase
MIHHRRKACLNPALYGERSRIERFFNRVNHFQKIATPSKKRASNCLVTFKLATMQICLRQPAYSRPSSMFHFQPEQG